MGNKNQSKDKDTDKDVSVASKVMKVVGIGGSEDSDSAKVVDNTDKVQVPLAEPATMPKNIRKILNGATRKDN